MRFISRKALPHEIPAWVSAGAVFFVTISCIGRGGGHRTRDHATAESLLESVAHYHRNGRWFARLFLVMPDHVHALLSFPEPESMRAVIRDWKRFTARTSGILWQRDFFDHRLRSDESWPLKAAYIRENPVRKGLVADPADWPWLFEA